jgi:hypothetical protein
LRGTKDNPKNVRDPSPPLTIVMLTDRHSAQLRTAPQSCDQSFDHKLNKTLKASAETKNPIRVIRGYKLPGVYAPKEGYRYDGLYRVEKVPLRRSSYARESLTVASQAWMDKGVEGFMVCKYALKVRSRPFLRVGSSSSFRTNSACPANLHLLRRTPRVRRVKRTAKAAKLNRNRSRMPVRKRNGTTFRSVSWMWSNCASQQAVPLNTSTPQYNSCWLLGCCALGLLHARLSTGSAIAVSCLPFSTNLRHRFRPLPNLVK